MRKIIDKSQQKFICGDTHNIYSVELMVDDDQKFIVDKPRDQEFDRHVVHYDDEWCGCTYYKNNPSCPHITAVDKWSTLQKAEIKKQKDAIYEMDYSNDIQILITYNNDCYSIIKIDTDNNIGYVNRQISFGDVDYIVYLKYAAEQVTGKLSLYWHWVVDSVDDVRDPKLKGYLAGQTNLDQDGINRMLDIIKTNEGDYL